MNVKRFKDPIYGYIQIEEKFLTSFIDTFEFQRLRSIRQTSYSPLYSAALHNRFIHSIGVFHLGEMASKTLEDSVNNRYPTEAKEIDWSRVRYIFLIACLLHDIGHSPFSHSGEVFFLETLKNEKPEIYINLIEEVDEESFSKDMEYYYINNIHAAPHEIMSALIGLMKFKDAFSDAEDKALFARCITGYKYVNCVDFKESIYNIIISLLNSTIIDVDKLDYLIRDAYVIGYDTVAIDYVRLLESIMVQKVEGKYCLAYHKSALSVLENVIYAHDSERKWIQNHPVVLYEDFLVKNLIRIVNKYLSKKSIQKLFSKETLSKEGVNFGEEFKVRLMCDDDIVFFSKNLCNHKLIDEYFQRKDRRHPVWKSEAEYRTMFVPKLGESSLDKLEGLFCSFEKLLIDETGCAIINKNTKNVCADSLQKFLERVKDEKNLSPYDINIQKSRFDKYFKIIRFFSDFSKEHNILFDYAIISAKQFKSGFQKIELAESIIAFPNIEEECYNQLNKVISLLNASEQRDKFFFLYYRREENKKIDISELSHGLCKLCMDL